MRKLKLQVQMTVDGFIAGPGGQLDFMTWDWDDALKQYVDEITEAVDCIVLGRKLAEGFIPHWAGVAADPGHPEYSAGLKYSATPKVVFTKTLTAAPWDNTELARGDLADEINTLKARPGRDMIAYGGARFVSALLQHGLLDEFHLFVNPAASGSGLPIFAALERPQPLVLVQSIAFECGIVLLNYIPRRA